MCKYIKFIFKTYIQYYISFLSHLIAVAGLVDAKFPIELFKPLLSSFAESFKYFSIGFDNVPIPKIGADDMCFLLILFKLLPPAFVDCNVRLDLLLVLFSLAIVFCLCNVLF